MAAGAYPKNIHWNLYKKHWPALVLRVSRQGFLSLPRKVQPHWVRLHVKAKLRLERALQRAKDRLDRPPTQPLGTLTPTRAELIAHLRTAGRRFAREYWTDGLPLFFPSLDLGPVPAEFAFPPVQHRH